MEKENYKFQNIYIITTFKCNYNCPFCLFKYNKIKDAKIKKIINRLQYAIQDSKKQVYVKITGGEPFLKIELLKEIFNLLHNPKYIKKIYKIGIGTNGSIQFPEFLNNTKIRTDIFISKHDLLPLEKNYKNINNKNIKIKLNCNLIKGGIASYKEIIKYIQLYVKQQDIASICFRELNKINLKKNKFYNSFIHKYDKYYNENVIYIDDILNIIDKDICFKKTKIVGNYYDTNIWYWYMHNFSIKFRRIEEDKLIEYNQKEKDIIDEYVIHPDGKLTGCWDINLKKIKR
jgi:organic radical activating enzyme